MKVSDTQQKKILAASSIVEHGDMAVLVKILEMQDFLESYEKDSEEMKTVLSKIEEFKKYCEDMDMSSDSKIGEATSKLQQLVSKVEANLTKKIADSDSSEQIKKITDKFSRDLENLKSLIPTMPDLSIYESKLSELESKIPVFKETILDTPDQIVEKVISSEKKLPQYKIEGLQKDISDIRGIAASNSLPITTMFVNGKRAKNLSITGATVAVVGDTANITITGGGGGGTPGGSSGDVQWNNGGSFDGFGTFNGTNQLDLTDISLISAGVTTTGLFNQSGDQASFDVAGSTFAVKTTAYNSWGLIYADNTGIVTMGDYFGDANTTSIAIDDTATTIGYSATGGHTFTGNVIVDTDTLYVDSASNTVSIGTTSSLSKLAVVTDALGTTQTDTSGLVLANTTLATSGVTRQISPGLRFRGSAWKSNATAASQTVDFNQYVVPNTGAAAVTGDLFFTASINGGAYSSLMALSSAGVLTMYQAATRVIDVSASSTTIIGLRIQNTNNSTASSVARNEITVGGSSGGDPQTNYVVSGTTDWVTGIDNSDSDSFKLSQNATLGTNDRFIMTTAGLFSLRAGLSTKRATVGGAIKEYFTSVGNVTTGEDNLFTYTTEANIFGTNGDNIEGEYSGTTAANGNNKTFKFYFAGTNILNSGALALNDKNWKFSFKLIRVSATVVRYSVQFTYEGNTAEILEVGELTGLTLSGTNILKITGEATATDDIVATMGTVTATPVSV